MKLNAIVTMVVFAACVAAVQSVPAFPTQTEIKTATDVVGDLIADDIRNANAGKLKREDVADKLVGLVDRAESDAAKWVLYKHAFIQYAKAYDFEKVGEVLSNMVSAFPDVPPQTVIALIDKNCGKANAKNAPVIVKMRKLMFMRQKCGGIVANAKASKKEKAEACCLMGDWAKGLKMFTDVGGKAAEMAAAETSGSQPKHVVANYWWDYKSALDTCDQFKAHAAEIYKAGLEDDSFSGLYKDIAEKRIAEMEAVPMVEAAPKTGANDDLSKLKKICNTKGLVHCWRFNGNLKDCIGGSEAKCCGNAKIDKKQSSIFGGHCKIENSYVDLGPGLIPTDGSPVTIELWATQNQVQHWSRIFSFGKPDTANIWMTWSANSDNNMNGIHVQSGFGGNCIDGGGFPLQNSFSPYNLGVEYHIALILDRAAGSPWTMTVYKQDAKTGTTIHKQSMNLNPAWTLKGDAFPLGYLGRPTAPVGEHAANASYNEFRIWERALSEKELTQNAIKFHKAGETAK